MIEKYVRRKLFLWHKENYREFPWRHTKDPYKIMIAEFMLHRTRADQVVRVYQDFIKKYPDILTLACGKPTEVNKVTEKLGLHWRGKHFISAAIFIKDRFGNIMPDSRDKLLSIPGVGDYVAGAILTVVFNKKEWVVDSNIARFLNRFYGLKLRGEIRRKRELIEISKRLYQTARSGQLTFALLDFTGLICKPIKPVCNSCIIRRKCKYVKSIRKGERQVYV
ncbi:MAG: DNA glycosylase [Deltaproteobacteria bacterium]|nr:DNA glycosylase [Deltaproteobacteria bacterium]